MLTTSGALDGKYDGHLSWTNGVCFRKVGGPKGDENKYKDQTGTFWNIEGLYEELLQTFSSPQVINIINLKN